MEDTHETFGLSESADMNGTSPLVRRNYSPTRLRAIAEAATMWKRVFDGDPRAALRVREALSTSDLFVSATGDVLDREMLAQYAAVTPEWQSYADRTRVRNFKPKTFVDILGGRTALDSVPQLGEYPTSDYSTNESQISVAKFGRRFGFSWEALVNDDIDELQQIPARFAQAAALTEDREALAMIADSAGKPNANFFKTANGNKAGTAKLTADSLETAIQTVSTKKDTEGNIVAPGSLILVVGPALQFTAERLLTSSEIRTVSGDVTTVQANYLTGKVKLVVLSRLPGSSWFILPAPGQARPAVAVAFLRGWETPDLRYKADAGSRMGGGAVPQDEGSFDDDSIYYRVRHVVGAATVDPMFTYASDSSAA